jgi:hypothetical protein
MTIRESVSLLHGPASVAGGIMNIQKGSEPPRFTVEFGAEPDRASAERRRVQQERSRRNSRWLQGHREELFPQAVGKYLAVAGEEAFVADSPEEALALARQAHPEDDTVIVQYVRPGSGPRIYANRW